MKAYNLRKFGQFKNQNYEHGPKCSICRSMMKRRPYNARGRAKAKLKKEYMKWKPKFASRIDVEESTIRFSKAKFTAAD